MIWRDIPGYLGYYKAGECGQILSLDRSVKGCSGERKIKGTILKQLIDKNGYLSVYLCMDGKSKRVKVHRIIAMCFIDGFKQQDHVNHIDGKKYNNNAKNLEKTTPLENMRHAAKTGLRDHLKGEGNPASKLKFYQVRFIRTAHKCDNVSMNKLRKYFGVTLKTVQDIVHHRTWV